MTIIIIAFTALFSILAFNNIDLFHQLKFNAWLIKTKKQGWRFFTYAFVHAGWTHLAINMFVLYSFGRNIESSFNSIFGFPKGLFNYGMLYVGGIIFSTLFDFGKQKNNPYYDAVGASGAVAAIVFASILIDPKMSLFLFPIPIPIPAYIFGGLYLIYSAYMGKRGQDNIGHYAHFFGAVFGFVFTLLLKPSLLNEFIQHFLG
ncbi:MAG: rhomboid family intramembrane serine protease [Bacteroidetes bacterium]|nr:rhomboid family intramembrane serine protease [Bacteroidota bacterium]